MMKVQRACWIAAFLGSVALVEGFGGIAEAFSAAFHAPHIDTLHHAVHMPLAPAAKHAIAASVKHNPAGHLLKHTPAASLLKAYTETLKSHPLATKMMTGGLLATGGDAIAQSTNQEEEYDRQRAISFTFFDMAYRALQHVSFPIIVKECHGQFMSAALAPLGMMHLFEGHTDYLAAMEQTLASQLGIVPFIYYPVFFALTGVIQGLTAEQAIQRAQENFLPLMQRNLLFWIPVQFVQFAFIPTDLQIPFLSVCGLCWTFILSMSAGSTKGYASEETEEAVPVPYLTAADSEQEQLATMAAQIILEESQAEALTLDGGDREEVGELVMR